MTLTFAGFPGRSILSRNAGLLVPTIVTHLLKARTARISTHVREKKETQNIPVAWPDVEASEARRRDPIEEAADSIREGLHTFPGVAPHPNWVHRIRTPSREEGVPGDLVPNRRDRSLKLTTRRRKPKTKTETADSSVDQTVGSLTLTYWPVSGSGMRGDKKRNGLDLEMTRGRPRGTGGDGRLEQFSTLERFSTRGKVSTILALDLVFLETVSCAAFGPLIEVCIRDLIADEIRREI